MLGWCDQERDQHTRLRSLFHLLLEKIKSSVYSRRHFFFICHYVHTIYLTVEPNSSQKVWAPPWAPPALPAWRLSMFLVQGPKTLRSM